MSSGVVWILKKSCNSFVVYLTKWDLLGTSNWGMFCKPAPRGALRFTSRSFAYACAREFEHFHHEKVTVVRVRKRAAPQWRMRDMTRIASDMFLRDFERHKPATRAELINTWLRDGNITKSDAIMLLCGVQREGADRWPGYTRTLDPTRKSGMRVEP